MPMIPGRLLAFFLLTFLVGHTAIGAEAPGRVISLDYCADQYVLKMLPRNRILAVSTDAGKLFSYLREHAAGIATVRSTAEDVLMRAPDLVVRSYGGGPRITALLESAGIPVLQIPYTNDIQGIRDATRHIAAALGNSSRGESIVADFDARLAAIADRPKSSKSMLYMTPTGVTSGPGTLVHEMLLAAGYENSVDRSGWQTLPLEKLAYRQPDAIAAAFFGADDDIPAQWSAMRHPVAQQQMVDRPTALLQGAWTSCGAWFLVDAIEALADLQQTAAEP